VRWSIDVDFHALILTFIARLHREVDAFVKYMSPSPVEDEVRSLIVRSISNAVTRAYPDAKVLPFGSYQTKLYLPSG
jgi:non-canonical poly(A) RNA polymerase PAPD5/7